MHLEMSYKFILCANVCVSLEFLVEGFVSLILQIGELDKITT